MQRLKITLQDLFDLRNSVIYNPDDYKDTGFVSIDSRNIKSNGIFIAIKGEKFDGHDFVNSAINNGAGTVIINENSLTRFKNINNTLVAVPDTIKAFGELANMWRHKLSAKVISLTGSNGKTTTKEFLSTLLSSKYNTVKTISNNNNHIGVPLTIFSADHTTEMLILEHGTNHFGEIDYTAEIADPDIAAITIIGESHLEYLINKKGVLKEKGALLAKCIKNKGRIIINQDDTYLRNSFKNYKNRLTIGFKESDINGKIIGYDELGRTQLNITTPKFNLNVTLPVLAKSNAQNYLAAVAMAYAAGLGKADILKSTSQIKETKGRLQSCVLKNTLIIDDTYNANPVSMKAAFDVISKIKKYKNTLIVLGDMFELGKDAIQMHKELAGSIGKLKHVQVFTIGKLMKHLNLELAKKGIDAKHFASRNSLINKLNKFDFNNYKILVKGSRGMKMEEFFETIKQKAS